MVQIPSFAVCVYCASELGLERPTRPIFGRQAVWMLALCEMFCFEATLFGRRFTRCAVEFWLVFYLYNTNILISTYQWCGMLVDYGLFNRNLLNCDEQFGSLASLIGWKDIWTTVLPRVAAMKYEWLPIVDARFSNTRTRLKTEQASSKSE